MLFSIVKECGLMGNKAVHAKNKPVHERKKAIYIHVKKQSIQRKKKTIFVGKKTILMDKGSSVTDILIGAAILVFLIIPVFAAIIERYIILTKIQIIKDSVDLTNSSVYNALSAEGLGKNIVSFDSEKVRDVFVGILSQNMNLDENLSPRENSIADGKVFVKSLEVYTDDVPNTCPNGERIVRPTIHSCITVPIRPSLYTSKILELAGKSYFEFDIHVDSEIPINN